MEIVRQGQNLLDLALQATGDADTALDIALVNGLCLSDDLTVGQTIEVSDTLTGNENIRQLYAARAIHPATGITATNSSAAPFEGIEFWAVEYDFIIS